MTDINKETYRALLEEVLKGATELTDRLTSRKFFLKARMATPEKVKRIVKNKIKKLTFQV